MDEDLGDLSQLLAFADALADSNEPVWEDGSAADKIHVTTEWKRPELISGSVVNNFANVLRSVQSEDVGETDTSASSPESPTMRNRTALFSAVDKLIDIELCGEWTDPRCVNIVDHPGRHAQFKNWHQAGYIEDDTRRMSIRDESARPACWAVPESAQPSNAAPDKGVLGMLLGKTKTSEESPVIPTLLAEPAKREDNHGSMTWKDRTFVVGKTMKVAMREAGLHEGNIRDWCLWFNDMLCSLGLSDARASAAASTIQADIDFSNNSLTDSAVNELVNLLNAFKRLQVKTIRLGSNSLTDIGLGLLAELSHLRHLVVDDNAITSDGVISYVVRNYRHKQDLRDALLAQDVQDESIMEPTMISVEMNLITGAMGVIDLIEAEGIQVCLSDTTGCEPVGAECRLKGKACGVHLSGLGAQKTFR